MCHHSDVSSSRGINYFTPRVTIHPSIHRVVSSRASNGFDTIYIRLKKLLLIFTKQSIALCSVARWYFICSIQIFIAAMLLVQVSLSLMSARLSFFTFLAISGVQEASRVAWSIHFDWLMQGASNSSVSSYPTNLEDGTKISRLLHTLVVLYTTPRLSRKIRIHFDDDWQYQLVQITGQHHLSSG